MTHEIKIYGDIVPFKWNDGGDEYELKDLNNSLASLTLEENDELIVGIHTFGGDTATAFGIYNTLRNLKQRKNIQLTTRVDGWCASSGVMILLAGDKRIGNKYAEPFIHNAWTVTMGDKNDHKKTQEDLARVDNQIANLYAERTNIDKEKALELMNAEDYLNAEDALSFGFYTEFENVYSPENKIIFNSIRSQNLEQRQKFQNNMSDKNRKGTWNKLKKQIDDFFGGAKNKIVYTADNSELDFYELGEDDTPAVGDKAKFDGKPAGESNDGEYVMPSGETYKFTGEELTEIVAKTEDKDEDLAAENETLKEEVSNLQEEVKNLKSEKSALNKKLKDATTIISNFKNFENQFDDNEDEDKGKRDAKPNPDNTPKSRASNALSNLKNKNKDGDNK